MKLLLAAGLTVAAASVVLAADPPAGPQPPLFAGQVDKLQPNVWAKVDSADTTRAVSPGLVYSERLKRFLCVLGCTAHDFKGERPYEVQSFDLAKARWVNELPAGATTRGEETGNVRQVRFKTPFFAMQDEEGLVRPHPHHGTMYYQYAIAPWDGCVYALLCGHLVKYDPAARTWAELKPAGATPAPPATTRGGSLCWSALAADPVNKEIVLFGGCGVLTPDGSPGTWVYATEADQWRKLELKVQPGPRALSPMAFDPATRKIVLFGGDRLDMLYADTWLYDCATRTWAEAKPPVGPSPRFGHALLALPKAGKVLLVGGKGYTSSTSYVAMLYRPLPLEMWAYDVAKNAWSLLARPDKAGPEVAAVEPAVAAVDGDDVVMMLGAAPRRYDPHTTWVCKIDASKPDAEGTASFAVPAGAVEYRTGPYDPDWYAKDVPPPDPQANEKRLADLPANRWLALDCPKWPSNRMGGGWSTAVFDPVNDQVLQMGGGHSSYFGNDVAHYDVKAGRWSIACRPQFALDFNYDLNGPGMWAFNGAPWGNHNYHAYTFDPQLKRIVYIKGTMTLFYDPVSRTWPFEERFGELPFFVSKYVDYLCSTAGGTICWAPTGYGSSKTGLWKLEGKKWVPLKLSGDPLPMTVCDSSAICYDSKRDRLIFTTTPGGDNKSAEPAGQVWACDLKTGECRKLSPANAAALKPAGRFAREAVYLPKADLAMFGYLLDVDGKMVMPFYDCQENKWLVGEIPGSEFINAKGKAGSSVDLGLAYDAKRDLVWGVLCALNKGCLNAIRVSRDGLVELK